MKQTFQVAKFLIGWPLTIVAFFFIGKFIFSNIHAIFYAVYHTNIFFLCISLFLFLGYFFLRAFFWQKLLSLNKHHLSFKETAFLWGFAEAKRYVPGNIWSFVSRTASFHQKGVEKKELIHALFIEIQYLVVASLLISLLSINFIFYGIFPHIPYEQIVVSIVSFAVFLIAFIIIFSKSFFSKLSIFQAFSPPENTILLLIQTAAFLSFGIATYFSIAAFLYLYPVDFLTFVGFFVFSFLVGYLSFITPMGLGVREAVTTAGLIKFIPSLSLAGFASIISRIILVLGEILFLLIIFLWHKSRTRWISRSEKFIADHYREIILGAAIVTYCGYIITISILRYTNFYAGRFDLGNMDQVVWNSLHGRVFELTDPDGVNIISRLAIHADFILILLTPFYVLWQDPRMLLIIQTIVVALGAVFVYMLAKDVIKNKTVALALGVAYLLNPSLEHANLYDFHAVTLATTFLLGGFYFIKEKKYFWTVIFLFLAGITKEEVWIITALMGIYIFFAEKKKLLGASIFFISIATFFYLVSYAIPHARGGQQFVLSYYSDFGSSPKEIITHILFSPQKTIPTLLQQSQLTYLFELFFPLGFLSLAGWPLLLFIAPELGADLLSTNTHPHEIYYQYTATLTPFPFAPPKKAERLDHLTKIL